MPKVTRRGPSPEDLNPTEEESPVGDAYLKKWSKRHTKAEGVAKEIRSMAFPDVGEKPGVIETMAGEDPEAIGFSVSGGLQPHHMLSHEQTLRKWEVPDLPPSHHEGFGSSVAANIAAGTIPDTPHLKREVGKLAERMDPREAGRDPLGSVVRSRRTSIQQSLASGDPDAAWYQGKAQALIHHHAAQHDVPVPVMRKTTAAESPRLKWDVTYVQNRQNIKSGRAGQTVFPNIEAAGEIVEASKGRSPEEASEEVVKRNIPGVQRQAAAGVASSMLAGKLHGSDPIPVKGEAEKIQSFDVNLSDPTHPQYGYSAYVARHQLSAHTADVQDARAGGYHEEQLPVPRKLNPEGEPSGKPFHEEFLSHPPGADIAQSTALVATTEEFSTQRRKRGEEWARQNAINFMPGPSQSMQWSVARKTGTVGIPEHIEKEYANRPAPTGFPGYTGQGTRMTKRDRQQM
jgi:hypothetical protein